MEQNRPITGTLDIVFNSDRKKYLLYYKNFFWGQISSAEHDTLDAAWGDIVSGLQSLMFERIMDGTADRFTASENTSISQFLS